MSILLNYSAWSELFMGGRRGDLNLPVPVTPPPIIGLANGVAQSIVSLARGFGPLLGGYVCAVSLDMIIFFQLITLSRYGPHRYKETRRTTTSGS